MIPLHYAAISPDVALDTTFPKENAERDANPVRDVHQSSVLLVMPNAGSLKSFSLLSTNFAGLPYDMNASNPFIWECCRWFAS